MVLQHSPKQLNQMGTFLKKVKKTKKKQNRRTTSAVSKSPEALKFQIEIPLKNINYAPDAWLTHMRRGCVLRSFSLAATANILV